MVQLADDETGAGGVEGGPGRQQAASAGADSTALEPDAPGTAEGHDAGEGNDAGDSQVPGAKGGVAERVDRRYQVEQRVGAGQGPRPGPGRPGECGGAQDNRADDAPAEVKAEGAEAECEGGGGGAKKVDERSPEAVGEGAGGDGETSSGQEAEEAAESPEEKEVEAIVHGDRSMPRGAARSLPAGINGMGATPAPRETRGTPRSAPAGRTGGPTGGVAPIP